MVAETKDISAELKLIQDRKAAVRGIEPIDPTQALVRSIQEIFPLAITPPTLEPVPSEPVFGAPAPKRDMKRYNKAQMYEKPAFRNLLYALCQTIPPRPYKAGAGPRPIPLADIIFALVYKAYTNISSRRFTSDLSDMLRQGYISRKIHYNSVCGYFSDESVTPLLRQLIEGVAASFAGIETQFAIDASGFRIPKMGKWCDAKHGWRSRHEWMKLHMVCGVKTNIIVSFEITEKGVGDAKQFGPLLSNASQKFNVEEIAADRAYSTISNIERADALGIKAGIPFKNTANPFNHSEDSPWRKLFYFFALNQSQFREMVNRQNQAEVVFSMMKGKFGERVFNKSRTGQVNEILCKVLCHNICVLIYWLYEWGVDEKMLGELTPEPPKPQAEPSPQREYKYNAFHKVVASLDANIPNTNILASDRVVDPSPTPEEQVAQGESLISIVERLVIQEGLSRERAWAIVEKLL